MEKDLKEYINLPIVLIVALLIVSLLVMVPVLDMVILGAILAFLLKPLVKIVDKRIKYPTISIFLSMAVFIVPLILILVYMANVAFDLTSSLLFTSSLVGFDFSQVSVYISQFVPLSADSISSYMDGIMGNVVKYIGEYLISIVEDIPYILVEIIILIASIYYFVKDGDKCFNFVRSFISEKNMDFFNKTVNSIKEVLISIFYGHFLTAVIIGVAAAVGYYLLGYPFSGFLGVVTCICQLIPVIGPWPVYWVLFFSDLFTGNYTRMIIVLLFGFVLSVSDVYIRPALTSRYVDVHPLILLIGFLAGPLVFGIVGLILGPFFLGVTYAILKTYKEERKSDGT